MGKCVNIKHPEFQAILRQTEIHEDVLSAKMGVWMDENNTDEYPTLEQLGINKINLEKQDNIKATPTFASISTVPYNRLLTGDYIIEGDERETIRISTDSDNYKKAVQQLIDDGYSKGSIKVSVGKTGKTRKSITLIASRPKIDGDKIYPSHNVLSYNTIDDKPLRGIKYSTVIKDPIWENRGTIDIAHEMAAINRILPNVPVEIKRSLLRMPGGVAEGQFYNNIITLSTQASTGTGFHEAFHAVSMSYLTQTERDVLYDEYRDSVNNQQMSDEDIEEILAEKFRDYMLTKGESKVPGFLKPLYNAIMNLINYFKNAKRNRSQLFAEIRAGRFAYKPKTYMGEKLFHSIKLPSDMVASSVDAITYMFFDMAGIRSLDRDFDFTNNKTQEDLDELNEAKKDAIDLGKQIRNLKSVPQTSAIEAKLEKVLLAQSINNDMINYITGASFADDVAAQIYNEIADSYDDAIEAGDDYIAENIDHMLNNFDELMGLAKIELAKVNFDIRLGDEDISEDDAVGSLNITPSIERSAKKNATGNTKLLVSMLVDTEKQSPHFGQYFQLLANRDTSWRKLEEGLADIVDDSLINGEVMIAREAMLAKVKELAKDYAPFNELAEKLEAPESIVPEYKKIQFYSTFSLATNNFSSSLYKETSKDVVDVAIGSADSQTHANKLKSDWITEFVMDNVRNDKLVNRHTLNAQVTKFKTLDAKVSVPRYQVSSDEYIPYITQMMNLSGINISKNGITAFINAQEGESETAKLKNAVILLRPFFLAQIGIYNNQSSLEAALVKSDWSGDGFLNDQSKIMNALAKAEALFIKTPAENMVVGADGKQMWGKSRNSALTKTTQRWRANPGILQEFLTHDYHKASRWGANMFNKIIDGQGNTFGLSVVAFNKVEGTGDMGTTYTDMLKEDDIIERMNRTLNGSIINDGSSFSVLNFADKSTWYNMTGMPFESVNIAKGKISNTNGKKAINILMGYAQAEMDRIGKNISGGLQDVAYYSNSRALESFWFPELSYAPGSGNFADVNELYSKAGNVDNSKENLIKEHIAEHLERVINEESALIGDALNNSYNKINGNVLNEYNVKDIDPDIALEGTHRMLSDYIVNSMIANIEFTMLYTGDPAFYKDLPKRTPATSADGIDMMLSRDSKRKFKVAVIEDIEMMLDKTTYNTHHTEITKALIKRKGISKDVAKKQATKILKPYNEINQADGQGLVSPARFKDIMIMTGKWNSVKHDPLFKAIMSGDNEFENTWKLMDELGFPAGQPIKGVHFELVPNESTMIPTYFKYSQAVLWPGLIKNTPLEKLAAKMGDDIDEVVFRSAVKAGARNVTDMNDMLQNVGEVETELTPFELDNFNFRLQVDLPSKSRKVDSTLLGSQPRKNILANLVDKNIEYNGEVVSGSEIYRKMNEVEKLLSDIGAKKVDDLFGVIGVRADKSKIIESVRKQLIKDDADNNILEALLNGADVPLDAYFQLGEKIETIVYSMVNKRTVKLKAPGASMIQMSNGGMMTTFGVDNISKIPVKSQSDIIHLKDAKTLQGPRMVDGKVIPGDVYIPYKAIEKIPDIENKIANGELTGEMVADLLGNTLSSVMGYRIPNQNISSIETLSVAGILPPYMGDTIITYTEVTAKTGSDFDIDKMYVMLYNSTMDKETGKMTRVPSNGNTEAALQNRRTDLWSAVLTAPETYNELITPLDSEDLRNDAYFLHLLDELAPKRINGELVTADPTAILDGMGVTSIEALLKLPNKEELAYKYLSRVKLNTLEFAKPSYQLDLKHRNIVGKAGTGQTANQLTHHPLAQHARLGYVEKLFPGVNEAEWKGTSLYGEINNDGELITQVISAWINAYVDAAKDPYISYINNNTKTANTVFMLLRAGVSPKIVNRFMSQPMIRDYVKNQLKTEAKLITHAKAPKNTAFNTMVVSNGKFNTFAKRGKYDALALTLMKWGIGDIHSAPIKTNVLNKASLFSQKTLEQEAIQPTDDAQFNYLKKFLWLADKATALNDLVKASKYDTDGGNKDMATNMAMINLYDKAINNQALVNADKLFRDVDGNETFIAAMKRNSSDKVKNLLNKTFITNSESARANLDYVNHLIGVDGTSKEINKVVLRGFKSYIYSGTSMLKATPNEIKTLFNGPVSVMKRTMIIKSMFPEHRLVKHFGTRRDIENNIDFVTNPSTKGKGSVEIDEMWLELENMLDSKSDESKVIIGKTTESTYKILPVSGVETLKIINGEQVATSRTKPLTPGTRYQLPGGTVVEVTDVIHMPVRDLQNAEDIAKLNAWAKVEGYKNLDDLRRTTKYQHILDYADGKRALSENFLKVINEGVDYTMRDYAKDLVKYSYYGSGFQKGINTMFNLIPHTYMAGKYNITNEQGNFYEYIKSKSEELMQYTQDQSFIDSFFRHEFTNDSIVPKLIVFNTIDYMGNESTDYNSLPIEREGSIIKDGFTMKRNSIPESFIAEKHSNGTIRIKPYVKIVNNSTGHILLFKYTGDKYGDYKFVTVSPLKHSFKGNHIFTYQYGTIPQPAFATPTNADLNHTAADDVIQSEETENIILGDAIVIDKNSFKFENIPEASFHVVTKVTEAGTRYNVISKRIGDNEGMYTRSVLTESELGLTREDALSAAQIKLEKAGYKSIKNSINTKC